VSEHDEFLGELGALADLVAQAKVADWAEFFANKLENGASRSPANLEYFRKVAARLRDYVRRLYRTAQV
jgi:hypothetical protein